MNKKTVSKRKGRPAVTAVMVTGMHRARYALAEIAIQCFREQTLPDCELLIINHGPVSLHTGEPQIRELRVRKGRDDTVGDLRNIGLKEARGEFVISWDDDDWHAPRRIEAQLAAQRGGAAVVLKNQIRFNLLNSSAFYEHVPHGISGTILHPRKIPFQYRSMSRGSDTVFMHSFRKVTVLDEEPSLYVRFYHGLNLWDARHIMHHLADANIRNRLEVNARDRKQLRALVAKHSDAYAPFLGEPPRRTSRTAVRS